MTDTAESVRKAVQDYVGYVTVHHGIGAELLAIGRNYAALLEQIEKAPRANVSMVASNQEVGKSDAVTAGTYLHGEDEALLNLTGKRVALLQVED